MTTGFPASIALMFFGSIKHMVLEGRWTCLTQGMREAYRAGAAADRLIPVYWERHWATPVTALRERFGIRTLSAV